MARCAACSREMDLTAYDLLMEASQPSWGHLCDTCLEEFIEDRNAAEVPFSVGGLT